jgi:hypothetical protein
MSPNKRHIQCGRGVGMDAVKTDIEKAGGGRQAHLAGRSGYNRAYVDTENVG